MSDSVDPRTKFGRVVLVPKARNETRTCGEAEVWKEARNFVALKSEAGDEIPGLTSAEPH